MMQFHGFFMKRHFFSHNCTGHPTETRTLTASGFLMTNTFPGMSVADYVENLAKHVFLWKIGKRTGIITNLVPRAFFHFLREKPWGRGWYYYMIYNGVLSIRNDFR